MTDAIRSSSRAAQTAPTTQRSITAPEVSKKTPVAAAVDSYVAAPKNAIAARDSLTMAPGAFQPTDARLLSIDGGGVYGIIPARILQYIEERTGHLASELFHLVAATSTGGIIGAAIGLKIPCKQVVQLYLEDAQHVFERSNGYRIASAEGFIKPKFPEEGLLSVLKKHLGDQRLDESACDLVMPAHDLEQGIPKFFESWDTHYRYLMRDSVRATVSAPVFPPARVQDLDGLEKEMFLVDGAFAGLSNPVTLALAEAFKLYPKAQRIAMLSLGTGDQVTTVKGNDARGWGFTQFALPMLNIINSSPTVANDFLARHYLTPGETYFRINPPVRSGGFDDGSVKNMTQLLKQTDAYIEENKAQLDALCDALVAEKASRETFVAS